VLLVSPRLWGTLSEHQRERVIPIRYCIRPYEMEVIGVSLGWAPASLQVSA
jgi:hypothetical protein